MLLQNCYNLDGKVDSRGSGRSLPVMAVIDIVNSSGTPLSAVSGKDLCSNRECLQFAQVNCPACELRYCHGHSKHPEHA